MMKILQTNNRLFLYSLAILGILMFSACEDDESPIDESLFPVASFATSSTAIEAGESVAFTDNSTNSPSLWKWTFEGGNPTYSLEANPTVIYPGSGMYTVTMKARNDFGADEIVMEQLIVVTSPPAVDIDIEPLVRYDFDDNLDNAGSVGIAAVPAGAAGYGVRPGGGGTYLMNASNTLTIPGYTGINGPAPRTVTAWVQSSETTRTTITHWGAHATGSRGTFAINPTGTIRYEVAGGGINGVTPVNDGAWHHVAHRWDGATVRLYVDGLEDASWTTDIINTGSAGETEVEIGTQFGARPFIGSIDDFRIFAEVLTAEQIKILSEIR
jgi:PKD repeat protein